MSDLSSLEQQALINLEISDHQVKSPEDLIPTLLALTTDNNKEWGLSRQVLGDLLELLGPSFP